MSSDLGLIAFQDGELSTFSSDIVLKALKPFIRPIIDARFPEYWELAFPGGGGNMEPVLEGTEQNGLAINRPCGTELFDALYENTRQTHTLLYWTGGQHDNRRPFDRGPPARRLHRKLWRSAPGEERRGYFGGNREDMIDYLAQTLRRQRSH